MSRLKFKAKGQSSRSEEEKSATKVVVATSSDGLFSSCVVYLSQKQATGQQLIDKICEKLNLLEKEYFSCTFVKRDVKVKMLP